MQTHPSVYLAGPITGLSYGGCTDWRKLAEAKLAKSNIKGWSPMRAKEYLAHLTNISGTGKDYEHLGVFASARGIMTRDRYDCTRCDVLLVNFLGATQISIGTCMEVAWADVNRIPIVVAMEPDGNPHEHMMLAEATGFRVPTLTEALDVVIAILV